MYQNNQNIINNVNIHCDFKVTRGREDIINNDEEKDADIDNEVNMMNGMCMITMIIQ